MSNLVLGFGCERGIVPRAVETGIRDFLDSNDCRVNDLDRLVTIELKNDEEGLLEAVDSLGLQLKFFDAEELEGISPPNPNPVVTRVVGIPGVAETTALKATDNGTMLAEKTIKHPIDRGMTLALARGNSAENRED